MIVSFFIQRILWVDCIGAFLTGVVLLLFSGWLSSLNGLSPTFVIGHAFVHLTYGAYSFSLVVRKQRPMSLLLLLIFANAAWACFCLVFAVTFVGSAPIFGMAQFLLEGVYLGGLAIVEWNRRQILASRTVRT